MTDRLKPAGFRRAHSGQLQSPLTLIVTGLAFSVDDRLKER